MSDSSDLQTLIDALPASNGVPEGQQIGGVIELTARTYTFTSTVHVPTGVTIQGQKTGTQVTGSLTGNLFEFHATGGLGCYDAGLRNMIVWNTGTGGAVGISSSTTGDCVNLLYEGLRLRSQGVPLNIRNPNGNYTYAPVIRNCTVYGSKTMFVDIKGVLFSIDNLICNGNRETWVTPPTQVVLLEGSGGSRGLWIEGNFAARLLTCKTGQQVHNFPHFEPGQSTSNGVDCQVYLEGRDGETHPAVYTFYPIMDFLQPTIPFITGGGRVTAICGYAAFEDTGGGAMAATDRATAFIAGTGGKLYQATPTNMLLLIDNS